MRFPGPTRHRDGFAVWAKRLEEGTYALPQSREKAREMSAAELSALLSGIDLNVAQRRRRYGRPANRK